MARVGDRVGQSPVAGDGRPHVPDDLTVGPEVRHHTAPRRPIGRRLGPLLRPVAILVAARLVMWGAIAFFSNLFDHPTLNPWDGGWYVMAARAGWPHHVLPGTGGPAQDTLAFFPGFPTVIRVVHFAVPLTWMRAGEVAAFLTEVVMAIALWLLARDVWGPKAADRGVVAMCFFPGAFVLAMMYSEPLTIAAAAFCLLALRRRLWVLAGVAAAVGGITRMLGVALVLACAWEAVLAIRRKRDWRSLAAPVIAPFGVVAWFAYLWASTGDATAWFDTEHNGWNQYTNIAAVPDLVGRVFGSHPAQVGDLLAVASTALAVLLLIVLVAGRAPAAWIVYSVAVLAVSATTVNPSGIRFRFVWTAFPLVLVTARYLKESAFAVAVAVSSVVTGVILVVTLMGPALIP